MVLTPRPGGRTVPVTLELPGDKSIAQRAILLALCARGRSVIDGAPSGEDIRAALRAARALGARVRRHPGGRLVIRSKGIRALRMADLRIHCGESATLMRLLAGILAGVPGRCRLTGAPSLRRRPMARIVAPLSAMGARIRPTVRGTAPLFIAGSSLHPIDWTVDPPSAQVKSAILLASALHAPGAAVREAVATRDHTERLLARAADPGNRRHPVKPFHLAVPGDFSSAMLLLAAALLLPGAPPLTLRGVGMNPSRTRALDLLRAAGADLRVSVTDGSGPGGEPRGTIELRPGAPLAPLAIGPDDAARAIDELPALLAVAAVAPGVSELSGAGELRVKERDRLAACAALLAAFGRPVAERPDGLTIVGGPLAPGEGDGTGDHRIAACAAILALASGGSAAGMESLAKSFPGFLAALAALGARFTLERGAGGRVLLHSWESGKWSVASG